MDGFESDEATERRSDGGKGTETGKPGWAKEDAAGNPKRPRANSQLDQAKARTLAPLVACAAPTPEDQLPHALTFFLSAGQRRAVLTALRAHHVRRAEALLRVLGIEHD